MAKIAEILAYKWPGAQWTLSADDYQTLRWLSVPPKPTLAEIQVFSAEVDGLIAERQARRAREQAFLALDVDALYMTIKILAAAVKDLQTKAVALGPNDAAVTAINALVSKTQA